MEDIKETGQELSKTFVPGVLQGEAVKRQVKQKQRREVAAAQQEAEKAKQEAREKLIPMPDPELMKTEQRKRATRRRMQRGGRASTILSGERETLG